jgi:hypothetical protein
MAGQFAKASGSIAEVITRAGHFIPAARGLLPTFDFEQSFRHTLSCHACKAIP